MKLIDRFRAAARAFTLSKKLQPVDYRELLKAYMIQMEINTPHMQNGYPAPIDVYLSKPQIDELKTIQSEVSEFWDEVKAKIEEETGAEKVDGFVAQSTQIH